MQGVNLPSYNIYATTHKQFPSTQSNAFSFTLPHLVASTSWNGPCTISPAIRKAQITYGQICTRALLCIKSRRIISFCVAKSITNTRTHQFWRRRAMVISVCSSGCASKGCVISRTHAHRMQSESDKHVTVCLRQRTQPHTFAARRRAAVTCRCLNGYTLRYVFCFKHVCARWLPRADIWTC